MNRPHESERWRRVVEVLLTETERLTDPNVRRRRLGEVVEELTRKGMSAQQPSARVGYLLEAAPQTTWLRGELLYQRTRLQLACQKLVRRVAPLGSSRPSTSPCFLSSLDG